MPTIFSHAVVAATIGIAMGGSSRVPRRICGLGAIAAMIPDADVIMFAFGLPYEHLLGHRGLSHAPAVAAVAAAAFSGLSPVSARDRFTARWLWAYFFLAMASHGVLDAMTTGGRGIAFLAPFSGDRFFLPWRPILVSPIGVRFFSERGANVIQSELLWIWLPCACVAGLILFARARRAAAASSEASS